MTGLTSSNTTSADDNALVELADGTTTGASKPKQKVDSENRAWVDANISSASNVPKNIIVYKPDYCKNSGSIPMNVNGSITPQNFDYSPAASETLYVDAIGIVIVDTSSPDFGEFGSLGSALTNGLQLKVRTNGTEYTFVNMQTNIDLTMNFTGDYTNIAMAAGLGWLNEVDFFVGFMTFAVPLTLKNSASDYVRFTVRDNLSGIDRLHTFVKAWKTI